VLVTGPTVPVTGVATGGLASDGVGPLASEYTVDLRGVDGRPHPTDVASDQPLPAGREVALEVSAAHPGRARLDAPDDPLARSAGVGLAVGALCFAWAVLAGVRPVRRTAQVRQAAGTPGRVALGLLVADVVGAPLALVCDPLVAPLRWSAVPLCTPLPHGTAGRFAAGTALRVSGRPAGGAALVLTVPGSPDPLLPAGPAVVLEPAEVAALAGAAEEPVAG
jgi:hypothetical protein